MENFSTFVRTLGTQFVRGKKFFTTQIGVLGLLTDNTGSAGTAGKVLSSTGSGVQWITVGGGSSNVADLDDLTDVVITTASSGQLLRFNGTSWVNWTPNFLTAYGSLNDLSDVTLTTPVNGARLIYSSSTSQWIDANPLGVNKIYYGTASGDAATTNVITNGTRLSVGTLAMPTNLNVGQVEITTGIVGEGSIHIGGIADNEVYLLASRNKIQVGSQVVTFIPGEGEGDEGETTTVFTPSTLNIQPIGGQTVFGGLVTATGFKTPSGTSLGFLKADGSVDTTQYLPSGQIDLDDLSDVIITSPSSGQILRYELPLGELVPVWRNVTPGYLTPNSSIDSLVDVAISGAAVDQLLRWNGTYWINWTPNFLTSFTETDPTVPAHVKTISTTNISNWDAGYNDSIRGISFSTLTGVLTLTQMDLGTLTVDLDGRYLESYTETDPVFSASPAATIEQPSIDKWNQAYFWGDHSLVGYLTEESDTLDTVTSRGSTTANAVDVGGITTPYVQFEEVEEAHGIARSINWSEDHNALEVFYADEKHFDVGQDQMWYVKNGAEETLLKGTVVMAIGAVGNSGKIEVAPLVADGTVSGRYAIGILMDDTRSGEFGFVMTQGKLRGIDTGEFTEGDTLYPDPLIPGALINVEPASPALKLPIAFVVTAASNGAIAVRMTQGLDLHEVHDVQITSPANGQLLRLETGVWTNFTPSYIEAETDPVFIASPAASITSGAIDKWNSAYGWGDHSLAGYLTSFTETDPTVPAHVKSITEQNKIDWNKAYGWGNHADAGYLTSYENNYISDVRISEYIVTFTGQGDAFNGDVDFSELPFAPVTHNHVIGEITGLETALAGKQPIGNYITTETDPTVPAHVKSITEQNIIDWNKAYGWGNHADYGYLTSLPTHTHAIADVTGLQTALDGKVPTTRTITINGTALDLSENRSWTISSADGYISNVKLTETTLSFSGEGSAFSGDIDLSTLPFAPQGSYLTAEADTLQTVTSRGSSTTTGANFGGSVGIGTTAPNTKLRVQETTTSPPLAIQNTNADGYSGAWIYNSANTLVGHFGWANGTTTTLSDKMYFGTIAAKDVVFTTNDSEKVRITSAGNVGIGTTSPSAKLEVVGDGNGTAKIGSAGFGSNYTGISLNGTLSTGSYNFLSSTSDNNLYINRPTGNNIYFRVNNSDQMTILSSGNVGIGTESGFNSVSGTETTLHISNSNAASLYLSATGGSGNKYVMYSSSSGNFQIYNATQNNYPLGIAASGNVGIGTTAPAYTLDVQANTTSEPYVQARFLNTNSSGTEYGGILINGTNQAHIRFLTGTSTWGGSGAKQWQIRTGFGSNTDALSIYSWTAGTEVIYFNSSANVGIGTTSPSTKLDVSGVITATGGNSTNWNTAYGWGNHVTAGYFKLEGTEPITIQAETVTFTGSVTVEGTFTESSSIRFKENITPLDPALDKVNQLEAVCYNKIGVDDREIGLIAEDVAELFPEVVTYNEEGQPQGIQYQRLSVILLKAVQELTERVNKLENK